MKLFKTIIKGTWYTILIWVVFLLLLAAGLVLVPFVLLIIPIGAFSYAHNPELIIKDLDEKEDA